MRIFYQAPVSYGWIRQRPHEFAEGMAKCGHQVLWFYAGNFLKVRFRRFDDGGGLAVLELPALPFASRFLPFAWLNRLWCSWWLRKYAPDVLVATSPIIFQWMPRRFTLVPQVYDCMDIQAAFYTGLLRRRMIAAERSLLRRVNRIVASSTVICDRLIADYSICSDIIDVVPNGISGRMLTKKGDGKTLVRHLSVAYYGTIGKWFDWESVLDAARSHPEWKFELFGPVDAALPVLPSNVILQGALPHDVMLNSMASAQVLLLPFVRNELIDGVDPVKMYEYLSTGRPIVSSWWPLLSKFKEFPAVRFYGREQLSARLDGDEHSFDRVDNWSLTLTEALFAALNGEQWFNPPRDFLSNCNWSLRVSSFMNSLQKLQQDCP